MYSRPTIAIGYLIFDESQQWRNNDCDLGSCHDARELKDERLATARWHRNVDWKVAQDGFKATTATTITSHVATGLSAKHV